MDHSKLRLKRKEILHLKEFVAKGQKSARAVARANVLLLLHKQERPTKIFKILNISRATVYNVRNRYAADGLAGALVEKPRSGQPRKYDEKHQVEIIALACTSAPKGRKRWTVRLLTERMKKKRGCSTINRETVRLILKKRGQSLG